MPSVTLSWAANQQNDNVTDYEVWGANGISVAFASCTKLATVTALTWTDADQPAGQARTYYVRAVNVVGDSAPDGPLNITVSSLSASYVQNEGGAPSVQEDVHASRPTAGTPGRLYIETDTKTLWRDNGTGWDLIGSSLTLTNDVTGSGSGTIPTTVVSYGGGAVSLVYKNAASIGIGQGAPLGATTTGDNNVAIGSGAMASITTGNKNFALGSNALAAETTGIQNVAIGYQAGLLQNGASKNTLIGNNAGPNLTTGNHNFMLGVQAGAGITTGSNNTIVGSAGGLAAGLSNNIILADGAGNIGAQFDGTNWKFTNMPFGFAFQRSVSSIATGDGVAFFDTPIAWTIPSGATLSSGVTGGAWAAAPSADTDFDIQSPPGTSIGTMRFAASSLTATFIMASSHSIPAGQAVEIVAPSSLNGMAGTLYGTIAGTR